MSTPTDAKTTATRLRESIWGSRGMPVDPVWIANQLGIDVLAVDLPPDVSAAIVKEEGSDPVILLSATDHRNRQRFSCAHELGHYAWRVDRGESHYTYADLRGEAAANGTDPEEIFANRFAAELLMPEDTVRELHASGTPRMLMALHFRVSDDAMRIRLKSLRLDRAAEAA